MDEKTYIGIDIGAEPSTVFMTAQPMALGYNAYAEELLKGVARSFGISYEQMSADYVRVEARARWSEQAAFLIRRAVTAMLDGKRGYYRKIRRARRLYRKSGDHSMSRIHMQWTWEEARQRRLRFYLHLSACRMDWDAYINKYLIDSYREEWKGPGR